MMPLEEYEALVRTINKVNQDAWVYRKKRGSAEPYKAVTKEDLEFLRHDIKWASWNEEVQDEKDDTPEYLYICTNQNEYKIGIAKNLKTRLQSIQTGCSAKAEYIRTYLYPSKKEARRIEKWLHRFFSDSKTYGEWFDADLNDIIAEADRIWEKHNRQLAGEQEIYIPKKVVPKKETMETLKKSTNTYDKWMLDTWISSACTRIHGFRLDRGLMYTSYSEYCNKEYNHEPMSRNEFYRMLRGMGYREISSHGHRYFVGLALKGVNV